MPRGITVREVDVLTLLALGLTNSGIAERLGTSARTVSTQIERLLTKLDQGTRGGLAALAVDSGLLRLPIPGGVDGTPGYRRRRVGGDRHQGPPRRGRTAATGVPAQTPAARRCTDPRPERPPPTGSRYCTDRLWPSRNSTPSAVLPDGPSNSSPPKSTSSAGTAWSAASAGSSTSRSTPSPPAMPAPRTPPSSTWSPTTANRSCTPRPSPSRSSRPRPTRPDSAPCSRPAPPRRSTASVWSVCSPTSNGAVFGGPHGRGIVSIEAATSSTRVTNEHFLAAAGARGGRWRTSSAFR